MGYYQLNKGLERAVKDSVRGFTNRQSVFLAGGNEYINIDAVQAALAATTVGTWGCWVKPVDATPIGAEYFISFGDTSDDSIIRVGILTDGRMFSSIRIAGTTQLTLLTTAQAFSNNTWSHLAIVQDGVELILYINGAKPTQEFGITTNKGAWFNDAGNLDNGRLGAQNQDGGGNMDLFNGNMDEVLFINRALTQPQILNIATLPVKDETGIANGVSMFRFDNDIVPVCTDFIGSNNGTYVNVIQSEIEFDVP